MDEQVKKQQNIFINFKDGSFSSFEDIDGHQIGQHWVAVIQKNETFLYRASSIANIHVTVKE